MAAFNNNNSKCECLCHTGAMAFLRSISLEAVGLGVQLAAGAHEFLIQTESALGAVGLSSSLEKVEMPEKQSQPEDMREGLKQVFLKQKKKPCQSLHSSTPKFF
jgi:hypothetical protein